MSDEYLSSINVDSLLDVLQVLVDEAADKAADNDSPRPVVTVLAGAHSVEGTPIRITERGRDKLLVLHDAATDLLTLLSVDVIRGVCLHKSSLHPEAVLGGKISAVHAESVAPTRLALERQVKDVEKKLCANGSSVQLTTEAPADAAGAVRMNLQHVLVALEKVVAEASGEPLFAQAFAGVSAITLRASSQQKLEVERSGSKLVLNVPSGHVLKSLNKTLESGISKSFDASSFLRLR